MDNHIMQMQFFDSFKGDFVSVRTVIEDYKLFFDKKLDPRCLLELFFKEKLSLFTYISHINDKLFFTEKDIEAKNFSEYHISFHTVNLDGNKKVIYPSTNCTYSKIDLKNKGKEYTFDELNIKGYIKYNQDTYEILNGTPCNTTILSKILFKNFFKINFRHAPLERVDIDKEINNNFEYISILSKHLGFFEIQYDLSENKVLRHHYEGDEYYISHLWISAENETDLKISFLDDIYILKTDLDYLFNDCQNLDIYNERKFKNSTKNTSESSMNYIYIYEQDKDDKIAELEAEIEALKSKRTPVNDSKEREIKTYKNLLLGMILALDIKENARKYRYWGKKGLNFSGLASEIIRQLEIHLEEHDEIRNKSTYERKLKEVVSLLQEYTTK